METISHREFRNQSGSVLERVRNGETIAITNHGEVAAILSPPHASAIDRLGAAGRLRKAINSEPFGLTERLHSDISSAELLDELRGDH